MTEIFIPINLKIEKNKIFKINELSKKDLSLLLKNFVLEEKTDFDSNFFSGIYLKTKKLDNDLIIFLNGICYKFYFLDYDYFSFSLETFGTKILKIDETLKKISKISLTFEKIISDLKSDKLLTNTKKEKIRDDIKNVFFQVSGVIFVLYKLKEKTIKNLGDLEKYDGKVEYEAEASLLSEIGKTKKIELDSTISSLENRLKLFLEVVSKIFL